MIMLFQMQDAMLRSLRAVVGSVVVTHALIELCNLLHFFICQLEVHDIKIVLDVIDVLATGDHDEAHLRVPSEDDLCGRLAVFLA